MSLAEVGVEASLDEAIEIGQELVSARDALIDAVDRRACGDNQFFEAVAPGYINSIQKMWFEQSDERRYEAFNDLSRLIKMEMSLVFESVEPIESIADRVEAYNTDVAAKELLDSGISPYPRTTTMVLLDMIDDYRPA